MELCVCMSPHESLWATHTLFKLPGFNCVALLKYLPTPLVGNPIIKILDTPLYIYIYIYIYCLTTRFLSNKDPVLIVHTYVHIYMFNTN